MRISTAGIAVVARLGDGTPQTFTFSGGGHTVSLEVLAQITLEINTINAAVSLGTFNLACRSICQI